MTTHRQDNLKVDIIASFRKIQLKALDQAIFSNILAKVSTTKYKLYPANPFMHLYIGIEIYRPSIARTKP